MLSFCNLGGEGECQGAHGESFLHRRDPRGTDPALSSSSSSFANTGSLRAREPDSWNKKGPKRLQTDPHSTERAKAAERSWGTRADDVGVLPGPVPCRNARAPRTFEMADSTVNSPDSWFPCPLPLSPLEVLKK